ncbi:RluA family pseudouridine synthase [Lentilactobacillus sp. SPB1-3]|uniref:RluA family pseudouridine synthase n=1 Tax=Lentilactobacillus terminaliae TaxID=3003483 RepID=A0ACD5DE76_9LACO|nr:RluA family pseudouridine synthase [Lentilactobacillus sp. SPB1-3]MCZ0977595.1 RluA family pseudouridine synthase [Lentilactobacillus sp. SPB1-3]
MKNEWHYNLTVPQSMDNVPLKRLLGEYYRLPKHLIYSIRKAQRVTVNSKYQPVNFNVHLNDQIALDFIPADFVNPFPNVAVTHNKNIEILFETPDVIVINKQRGDKTHPNQPGENGTTINQLAGYLQNQEVLPYMIHRLDMETSGAIIFAKSPAAVPPLVDDIRHKVTQRSYLSWVHGTFSTESGMIDIPIGRDPQDKRKRKPDEITGQKAITHYQVCESYYGYSLVKINLETGRTHQIRVHLASIGHPLVGDPLYATDKFENLLLHSETVTFKLPFYQNVVAVKAPIPSDFSQFKQYINNPND